MSPVEIALERETANDETALVVAVHVQPGEAVQKDDILFDIENSKATQELVAPVSGVLMHQLSIGDTVEFGVCLAWITPDAVATAATMTFESAAIVPAAPEPAPQPVDRAVALAQEPELIAPHFSTAAASLCRQFGLDDSRFTTAFVTAADVQALVHRQTSVLPATPELPLLAKSKVAEPAYSAGAGRKRAEIKALGAGAGQAFLSVIGTPVGPLQITRDPGHFLTGRITDLVIYEASRLLRAYPNLNAAYADGRVIRHDAIHAGMAIDGGGQLVVYGIENADRLDLPDLSAVMADAVARYLDNTLAASELSRASFTVTDLSEARLDFVFPLLPVGQSCIIGITHCDPQGYRLFIGFDHRVTEGREVALFLGELCARLHSFDTARTAPSPVALCAFCDRSAAEAVNVNKDKGLMRIIGRDGRDALCCASCWNGW